MAGVIAEALMVLSRPRYGRAVAKIMESRPCFDDLVIDYYRHWLAGVSPDDWEAAVYRIQQGVCDSNLVPTLQGRSFELIALIRYAVETGRLDPLASDLRALVVMDAAEVAKFATPIIRVLRLEGIDGDGRQSAASRVITTNVHPLSIARGNE